MKRKPQSKSQRPGAFGTIAGIMFLDVKGFSKLTQRELERFQDLVLPALAKIINKYRRDLLELNTWGDAIIAVSRDPVPLACLALKLRDYFTQTIFADLGIAHTLLSRISLHTGRVKYGRDPIRKRNGVIGSNVTLAARIEPIIFPGEVWATHQFADMLEPSTIKELMLAFDDLGIQDLAKHFDSRPLKRLRRAWEPDALSPPAQEALTIMRSRAASNQTLDVVGIGALNTDYIVTASSLRKDIPDLIAENEESFEVGMELQVSKEKINKYIRDICRSHPSISLGGSSFNTIKALKNALPELRCAFVGVAGISPAESSFVNVLDYLRIDRKLVKESSNSSGLCVSHTSEGERSLRTWPGANKEMRDHLRDKGDELIEMLRRTRIVHVTSLFDRDSPEILAGILREAKNQNPCLQISFDPGHVWATRSVSGEADYVQEIMELSSFLFFNQNEFKLLTNDLAVNNDLDRAREVFKSLPGHPVLILLKKYNQISAFYRLHDCVKEVVFRNKPVRKNRVEDATGAGDVFAAGILIAKMIPGLELRHGVEIGLKMVREKLRTAGATSYSSFRDIVDVYVDSL